MPCSRLYSKSSISQLTNLDKLSMIQPTITSTGSSLMTIKNNQILTEHSQTRKNSCYTQESLVFSCSQALWTTSLKSKTRGSSGVNSRSYSSMTPTTETARNLWPRATFAQWKLTVTSCTTFVSSDTDSNFSPPNACNFGKSTDCSTWHTR